MAIAREEGTIPLIDDLALVETPSWSKGRVLLLGDATHCLTLISGQGAGMALTSAAIPGDAGHIGQRMTAHATRGEGKPVMEGWITPHCICLFMMHPSQIRACFLRLHKT